MAIHINNIRMTNIHCRVGTGALVFFKSLPGLSRIFNFLNRNSHRQAIKIVMMISRIRVIISFYWSKN